MRDDLRLERYDAAQAEGITDRLVALYLEVYADAGEFYSEDRYRRQLGAHRQRDGWTLVTATTDGQLIGYIYGFPLAPDTGWWNGIQEPVSVDFTAEDGKRTFAISELMVGSEWRRQGVARALHDELVGSRPETRATLLVRPDNTAAQAAYRSWGWQEITHLTPSWDGSPTFAVMVKHLP
ncbi:Acetyltransferase (GNAT) family protein [Micromonospora nigra]|uniref:Acetyltransferase (GNAT) family protein n=1 Tax=Micromonospora nigra TaxID=145857 RepID=A0A1C6SGT9_9ACTN|nr:GNAT family N-acetyltransferase [Micromonospora nigra]SCL28627.1 Acetyltransferase (GNAT) family protein [Micromonospora nigra]